MCTKDERIGRSVRTGSAEGSTQDGGRARQRILAVEGQHSTIRGSTIRSHLLRSKPGAAVQNALRSPDTIRARRQQEAEERRLGLCERQLPHHALSTLPQPDHRRKRPLRSRETLRCRVPGRRAGETLVGSR